LKIAEFYFREYMHMIIQSTTTAELKEILDYLKKDIQNCLYIYIDLVQYGITNPNMKVWTSREEGTIDLVVMKYHNGFQIYSKETDRDVNDILELVKEYNPERISGNEAIIKQLEPLCKNNYKGSYGVVFHRTKEQLYGWPTEKQCAFANVSDIPEIADLLLAEKEFGDYYTKDELVKQLEDRYHTKMGRSMVIRESGKIVGHMATFAETHDIAIVSGTVMDKNYRNTDHFNTLNNEFHDQICRIEQKDVYFFSTSKRHIAFFNRYFEICATYGKLVKIK
jgi:hypothetical protein